MQKIILVLLMALLFLTGCSSNKAANTASSTEDSQAANSSKEQKDQTEQIVISELLGETLESAPEEWGEIKLESKGFRFDGLKDVIFYTTDNNIITSINIENKDIDVYSSKVGQTPAKVKEIMGDPLSEGEDEENGGYLLEFELNDTVSAYYSSSDENKPVENILLVSRPKTEIVVDTPQNSTAKHNVQARFVGTYNLGVVIEVINAGTTPVKNIVVEVEGHGYDSMGKKLITFNQGRTNYLAQGESKKIEIMTLANGGKIVDASVRKVLATPSE